MPARTLRALVIDPDPRVLGEIVRALAPRGFRVAGRRTPDDTLDYVRRAQPDVVLLGRPFMTESWKTQIRGASPRTVVVPVPEGPDSASAA